MLKILTGRLTKHLTEHLAESCLTKPWARALATPLQLLYSEKRCALCASPINKNSTTEQAYALGICTTCALKLPERKNGFCRSCGEFIDLGDGLCNNCLQNPPPWKAFYFYGAYAGYMRELLHQVKFSQGLHQAEALGKLLAAKFLAARLLAEPSALTAAYDCIIPVPLHKDSLRERGFNQSALLAGPVSRQLNIPLRQKLLIKNRATPTQHGLSRKLRLKNMQGVFSAGKVNNLRILLLDDVLTTGATLRCASLCLLQAGAERVDTAVLARTPKK